MSPTEPKPVHVSKSLAKKALQLMFGPTAYLQTLHGPTGATIGMRAVAKSGGQVSPILELTVKDGKSLEPEHLAELAFHTVVEAGRSMGWDVRRGLDRRGNPEVSCRRIPPPITVTLPDGPEHVSAGLGHGPRLEAADGDALSQELEKRGIALTEPCDECRDCGPDSQPCLFWGRWAVAKLELKPNPPAEPKAQVQLVAEAHPEDSIAAAVQAAAERS